MNTRNATPTSFARTRALAALLCALASIQSVRADTILVTSLADDGSPGTLRAALAAAVDGDVIDATGITGTITLLPQFLTSSQLGVTKSVGILGPGPDKLTIDGNQTSRVIRIFPGLNVVIDGFTIANGRAADAPAGSFPGDDGGGIYNDHSSLTVRNCVLIGNSAIEGGGAIFNDGRTSEGASLTLESSILSGNSAVAGGAIYNNGPSESTTLAVSDCTFSSNATVSSGPGGAILNVGAMTVIKSTFSQNSANRGGAIFNLNRSDRAAVIHCTLNSNSASDGGGAIFNASSTLAVIGSTLSSNVTDRFGGGILNEGSDGAFSTVILVDSTLSGNSSPVLGGGIMNFDGGFSTGSSAKLHIGNTILRAGSSGVNIDANDPVSSVTSLGFNLSSDDGGGFLTAVGDLINSDPVLGPLADNGGPTLTHLPLLGSPSIDGGSSDMVAVFGIATDQRGLARTVDDPAVTNAPFGDGTDIGAVEVQAATPPPEPDPVADVGITFHGADKSSVKQGEVLTYTIAVRNFGPDTAPNVVVNDLMSSGTGFKSARATKGSFVAPPVNESGAVVWTLGDMANGAAEGAELTVSVLVKGKTTVTNLVVVNSDADDPNAENNVASITTSVAAGGNTGGGKKK